MNYKHGQPMLIDQRLKTIFLHNLQMFRRPEFAIPLN